uniref:PDZ domain-containing protein n=1 Tax=Anopheles christyi TaxID=43041 RepID=A0A182KIU6_9DIPT
MHHMPPIGGVGTDQKPSKPLSYMANLMTVRLQRGDGQAWGFRLQGGKDFSAPLVLQR